MAQATDDYAANSDIFGKVELRQVQFTAHRARPGAIDPRGNVARKSCAITCPAGWPKGCPKKNNKGVPGGAAANSGGGRGRRLRARAYGGGSAAVPLTARRPPPRCRSPAAAARARRRRPPPPPIGAPEAWPPPPPGLLPNGCPNSSRVAHGAPGALQHPAAAPRCSTPLERQHSDLPNYRLAMPQKFTSCAPRSEVILLWSLARRRECTEHTDDFQAHLLALGAHSYTDIGGGG
eukprot:gene21220-biopygen4134